MSTLHPDPEHPAPPPRRRPLLDLLNLASLTWAGMFAVVTAVLVVVLR